MSNVSAGSPANEHDLARALELHAKGALDAAGEIYEARLRDTPRDHRLLTQLGLVRLQQNRLDEADALFERAIDIDPKAAAPRAWQAEVLRRRGELDPAIDGFRAALTIDPSFAPALFNLGLAERARGNRDGAQQAWIAFSTLRPADQRVCLELGILAYESGAYTVAADWLSRQLVRKPDDADAAYLAGLALERQARLLQAIECFAKAAQLAPQRADIRNAAGVARFNLALPQEAIGEYREALALDPKFHEARSNLLMALFHVLPADHEALYAEHVAWAARHAMVTPMPRSAFANRRELRRRLKIGYVSPRFGGGPLAHFFLPLLEAHDRDAVHATCYAVSSTNDEATQAMRAHADAWRNADSLDDDGLVAAIRQDEIDVLVDLAGHCPGHRLGVFARRGAPIQFTWMDYVGTTGLATIDYLVTDELHTPTGGPQRYTERVLRLPDTRLVYRPVAPLPDIAPSPAAARGFVTFGCFNRLNKLGAPVIAAWAKILSRTPSSRLVLKATAFGSPETCAIVRRRFERLGIAGNRLDLRPYTAEEEMIREYEEIDVVLDPFPYNGCTTTCDALSMGVPVVTVEGSTLPGRHGVALLTACGLRELVAQTPANYIELAVKLARPRADSQQARAALRARFLASPVCDAERFARAFEHLYRDAWIEWCASAYR
jgi:predicted O-linked N-acetylglucosamine transferase (SPINDLY family)